MDGIKVLSLLVMFLLLLVSKSKSECVKEADVIFALDSSNRVWGPDFKKQVQHVKAIVRQLDVSFTSFRIGVISYSNTAHTHIHLHEHIHQSGVTHAINQIMQYPGSSRTQLGLRRVREMFLSSGRNDVPKIAVIFTNGQSADPDMTEEEIELLRAGNIVTISVGIGDDVNQVELKNMASDNDHHFTVDTFAGLKQIQELLVERICEDAISKVDANNLIPLTKAVLGCGGKPADVVFVMDASNSIHPADFTKQLAFVNEMIGTFEIGSNRTRVGALTYADYPRHQFGLKNHKTKETLQEEVRGIQQSGGLTDTAAALKLLRRMFTPRRGSRNNVPHIAIVITDGRSDDPRETAKEAALLHKSGVHVFAIGVKEDIDQEELRQIASYPDASYMFTVKTYDALHTLAAVLEVKKCAAFITTTTPEPTTTTTTTTPAPTTTPTTTPTTPKPTTTKPTTIPTTKPTTQTTKPTTQTTKPTTQTTKPTTLTTTPTTRTSSPSTKLTTPTPRPTTKLTTATTKVTTMSNTATATSPSTDSNEDKMEEQLGGSAAEGKGKTEILTHPKTRIIPSFKGMKMSGDQAGCGLKRPADVVFAMPGSASPKDTNKSLRFLRTLTSYFRVSSDQVRVGFVPKDCHELPGFRLDDFDSTDEINKRLAALEYRKPNTAMSIHYLRSLSFKPCHGSRPEAKKIGVILLDDESYSLQETIVEARKAREEHDIEMFVIAIGKTVTEKEINSIASERTDVHQVRVNSYDELPDVVEDVVNMVNYSCQGLN